jgi:hypothetical protein
MLKQAVGESAGRSSHVNGDPAPNVNSEVNQRMLEFTAAATHKSLRRLKRYLVLK